MIKTNVSRLFFLACLSLGACGDNIHPPGGAPTDPGYGETDPNCGGDGCYEPPDAGNGTGSGSGSDAGTVGDPGDSGTGGTCGDGCAEGNVCVDDACVPDDATPPSADDTCQDNAHKVAVCHVPPGNPENLHTICVGKPAWVNAHLAHGDAIGPCPTD